MGYARWTVNALASPTRLHFKKILLLTDFSEPSELAIPYATAIAREYQSEVCALHVITPMALPETSSETASILIENSEELAQAQMQRLDSQLAGVLHDTLVTREISVWPAVERVLQERDVDLLILGTHGRTGARKFLLGSVAEEIFRSTNVPVLTIGPAVRKGVHSGGRFHRVLFPTDFSPEAEAAAPYAISMAEENQARLMLLNVMRSPDAARSAGTAQDSVANIMHRLYEVVPQTAEFWCRPEATVRFGNPGERILEAAADYDADLIVLGVRNPGSYLGAATHLEHTTAHRVVAHAVCPVLTVRGQAA
jgi:nucleotide-binding universal stress UspA family protein